MLRKILLCLLVSAWGLTRGSAQNPDTSLTVDTLRVVKLNVIPLPEEKPVIPAPYTFITRFTQQAENSPSPVDLIQMNDNLVRYQDPGNIAALLNQQNGLQVQTTTATPNGSVLRMRGLNGRYTQLLRDGFPVYGGLAGSYDLSQISPLDLQQIEIAKGPAGTFFGGGAGAGAVNLVSKNPWNNPEMLTQVNLSNIGAKDMAMYVSNSPRSFFSFNNLLQVHLQAPYDPGKDGFSDVPRMTRFNFNPQVSLATGDRRLVVTAGGVLCRDLREGGDLGVVKGQPVPAIQNYLDRQSMDRTASQVKADYFLRGGTRITLRNSQSWFSRLSQTQEFALSPLRTFGGKQFNSFSELSLTSTRPKNSFHTGLSFNRESFREGYLMDSSTARDQSINALSAWYLDQLRLDDKLSLEAGLRAEYVMASSSRGQGEGNLLVLPRLFALFQASQNIQLRLGGSAGYRMPTLFSEESEALGFRGVLPVNYTDVRPEKTLGAQGGISFTNFPAEGGLNVRADVQAFFMRVTDLVLLQPRGFATSEFLNYDATAYSRGIEANLNLQVKNLSFTAGYALNDVYLDDSISLTALTLVPEHAVKARLNYSIANLWSVSLNGNWKSSQWLYGGLQSRSLFIAGATVERRMDMFTFFLNASNVLNARQSRDESLLSPPYNTPQFTQVWAPLDGFYFNGGVTITL